MSGTLVTNAGQIVTANLLRIGAVPIDRFLILPPEGDTSDIAHWQAFAASSGSNSDSTTIISPSGLKLHKPYNVLTARTRDLEIVDKIANGGPVQCIADCCVEWRAGSVEPYWVSFVESKPGHTEHGCALRIQLSSRILCTYSVDTVYDSFPEAKRSCATLAIDQGVLDFIKYGNGQTQPAPRPAASRADGNAHRRTFTSLQDFYESLPRPFPDGTKETALNINPAAWLNTAIQTARGARLQTKFFSITEEAHGSLLHGCVLRLSRPSSEPLTYVLDPIFQKRSDVKAAVCLLAMSQGVGNYLRTVSQEVERRVTPSMKQLNDRTLTVLTTEIKKINGAKMEFSSTKDLDAYGCSMTISLASINPTPTEVRVFTVPPDYRSGNDAKAAVMCMAAEQGAVEFVRFRGENPPTGYRNLLSVSHWSEDDGSGVKTTGKKRKLEPGHDDRHSAQGHSRMSNKSGKKMRFGEEGSSSSNPTAHSRPNLPNDGEPHGRHFASSLPGRGRKWDNDRGVQRFKHG